MQDSTNAPRKSRPGLSTGPQANRVLGLRRVLLVAGGTLCVALALLGMFVPVLPTTPLLLLAAVCYARSSQRFYTWLMTNRWFGEYIRNYREGRGIPRRQKVLTILLLWLTIGYAAWSVMPRWWAAMILFGIAAAVTVHLLKIKTYRPEPRSNCVVTECDLPEEAI